MNSEIKLQQNEYRRLPHWMAAACAFVVFPLIWMGGLVTTYDAGMAVPDWPNTYGYNLFLYPIREWFFGPWDLFVEHGHRLLGSLAGLLAIFLVIAAFWKDRRRWFCWLAVAALGLVIIQGLLGGARVVMDERLLAKIHGCVGPAFFAFIAGLTVMVSKWWFRSSSVNETGSLLDPLVGLAAFGTLLSYVQLVVGAHLRHISIDADPVVYQLLVVAHVTLAIVIATWAIILAMSTLAPSYGGLGLRWLAFSILLLVVVQFGLGVSTWVFKFGVPGVLEPILVSETFTINEKSFLQMNIVTGHVAVGSLILALATCMTVRTWKLFAPKRTEITSKVA